MRSTKHIRTGFTLIEVLIVVVILGVLAAMVISTYANARTDSEKNGFGSAGRVFVEAAQRFMYETGNQLPATASGVMPAGFSGYIVDEYFGMPTPVGGSWDVEQNNFGIVSAIGVHFNGVGDTRDDAYMVDIDTMIDDGDLSTGGFRKLAADRYYFVLVD